MKGDAALTIRYPKQNFGDKILKFMEKERRIEVPEGFNEAHRGFGPYADVIVKRESFWKALFRKKGESLSH